MKHYAFIINPKSGRGGKMSLPAKFEQIAEKLNFEAKMFFTSKPGHAKELAQQAAGKFDAVFAVGGDGTANEVASGLLGSDTPLGIIPAGSGNGIARHLRIPMNAVEALKVLLNGERVEIDVWKAGAVPFFMLCGLGFDAHIAKEISSKKSRGPQAYIRLVTREYAAFKPKKVNISWEGGHYEGTPFLINMANGSQFGNNMKIAPKASITDGELDLGIIEKIPLQLVPEIVLRMWNGTLHNFKYYKTFRAKAYHVQSEYHWINIDGECRKTDREFSVGLADSKLNVIIPHGKKAMI